MKGDKVEAVINVAGGWAGGKAGLEAGLVVSAAELCEVVAGLLQEVPGLLVVWCQCCGCWCPEGGSLGQAMQIFSETWEA